MLDQEGEVPHRRPRPKHGQPEAAKLAAAWQYRAGQVVITAPRILSRRGGAKEQEVACNKRHDSDWN